MYFKFDFKFIMHRNLQIYILVYSEILKIKMSWQLH